MKIFKRKCDSCGELVLRLRLHYYGKGDWICNECKDELKEIWDENQNQNNI